MTSAHSRQLGRTALQLPVRLHATGVSRSTQSVIVVVACYLYVAITTAASAHAAATATRRIAGVGDMPFDSVTRGIRIRSSVPVSPLSVSKVRKNYVHP